MASRVRPVLLALGSAALFGASVPVSKALLGGMAPPVLAGLVYASMGAVLGAALAARRPRPAAPRGREWWILLAVAAVGGVAGPLCLFLGLRSLEGQAVSILLGLEGACTAALAGAAFREHIGREVWAAVAFGLAALLVLAEPWKGAPAPGVLLVGAATLCAALDNNLSRLLSGRDPVLIAAAKGAVAGPVLLAAGLAQGARLPTDPAVLAAAAAVGALSYGLSLVLFLRSMADLGAARTTALFSTAPLAGAVACWAALGERPGPAFGAAAALVAASVLLLLRERHDHEHVHEAMEHEHRHVHDEHHRHAHEGWEGPEPHSHPHRHGPLVHSHPHAPDLHHRHGHG
jgi:drug/metabolite transporter (DMT)-like permease